MTQSMSQTSKGELTTLRCFVSPPWILTYETLSNSDIKCSSKGDAPWGVEITTCDADRHIALTCQNSQGLFVPTLECHID